MSTKGKPLLDIAGKKFHLLTALQPGEKQTTGGNFYWRFRCDCGNIKEILPNNVRKKKHGIKSCGCLLKSRQHGKQILHQLMWDYKIGAKKRNLEYSLTEEQVIILISRPCKYCKISPSQIRNRGKHQLIYNGIDRIDNTIGYTKDNCVSCCKTCNMMKRDLTVKEFLNHIKKICTVSSVA